MISCAYFYARDGAFFYGTLNLFSLICGERLGRWCRGGDSGDCDRRCCDGESVGVGAAAWGREIGDLVRIPLRERGSFGVPTLDEDWRYEIVTRRTDPRAQDSDAAAASASAEARGRGSDFASQKMFGEVVSYIYIYI